MSISKYYETVTEAVNDLQEKGYLRNFTQHPENEYLICDQTSLQISPEEFQIDKIYKFESDTFPEAEMKVMAISSNIHHVKGLVVNVFGGHQENLTSGITELIKNPELDTKGLSEKILSFFIKPSGETSPEGLCALCWGYQQYDGKIRDLFEDKQIDVNNHKESYMIIEEFVKENLEGIKLKEGDIHSCSTCNNENILKKINKSDSL